MIIQLSSIIKDIRIDKYLSNLLHISRREIGYLFKSGKIKVNGKICNKSYSIKYGDLITLSFDNIQNNFDYSPLKIVFENNELIAIYKPKNFHSAMIFNSKYSVENFIKNLNKDFILLNRLDFITEGILLVAKSYNFFEKFKKLENNLLIEKSYFCFVEGKVPKPLLIKNKIDQKKRKKVKVINEQSDFSQTIVKPLAVYENFTFLNVKIYKGARHQIRAHLSTTGHPIIGDRLYGSGRKNFLLLCYCYKFLNSNIELNFYSLFKNTLKSKLKNLLNFN